MFANIKILESLSIKNPREAEEYLAYSKFLAIKGTRFQTKAILAFDEDYRATKARDSWGSNLDDLSADLSRGSTGATGKEFCFRWNLNPSGCPNPQSCRYKHLCIHCSSGKHKGKSCTGSASSPSGKKWTFLELKQAPLEVSQSAISGL